jgi:hypothetical protein
MLRGVIPPGRTEFNALVWNQDVLPECHLDDALWGYTIRMWEELQEWGAGRVEDQVTIRLLRMAARDWKDKDSRKPASIQSMRFAAVLGSRLLAQLLALEDKVGLELIG